MSMAKKDSKAEDLFEDLIYKEIKDDDIFNVVDISEDHSAEDSLQDLYFNESNAADESESAPPPPVGGKSNQKKMPSPASLKAVQNSEDYVVEASEIFPSEASDVRSHIDKTQQLPIAEPFEVVPISSHEKFKPLTKNIGDLQDHLRSSNYLEVAQNRVLELEKEVQKLRRDGEQLALAGKHFKELTDSLKSQVKQAESNYNNLQDIAKEEKKILMQSLEAKEIKISALQERVIDVEQRQGSQHENVRIRERELENRLEIMKAENEALTQSKDEMILDLKKQMSSVNSDIEKYRIQNQKMMSKFESKEELLRRTVKALRIALTMLEGSQVDED